MVELEQKNKARLLVVLSVGLVILLLLGLSVALQQPLYSAQTSLTSTYNKPANTYWKSAYFNSSQGKELAFFNFAFRSTNQSLGPVLMTVEFGPQLPESIHLDSVKFTFTSNDPFTWPDVAVRLPTNGFVPTQTSRIDVHKVIIDYQNMGFYGEATETFDIWFGIGGISASSSTNHSVSLTVDLTGHNPHPSLTGESYSGEAMFQIVAQPNGLLYVSDQ